MKKTLIRLSVLAKTAILIMIIYLCSALSYKAYNVVSSIFAPVNPDLCDGIALHLHKVYEGTHTDLNASFTELIKSNTELIEGCTATGYIESPKSEVHQWLSDYNIEKYTVSYKCDLLSFNLNDVYKMEDKFYILSYSLGPCGTENVYFDEISTLTTNARWYSTKYKIERQILNENFSLSNKALCIDLAQKSNEQESICE